MDDPGELFRFWLQYRYHEQGFSVPKLARALKVTPANVGHWLRHRGDLRTRHWQPIATFFKMGRPEDILADARQLWTVRENRRYYAAHVRAREGGTTASATARDAEPMHAATPLAAAAIEGSLGGAKTPRQPRRSGPQRTTRKTHGTQPGA